MTAKLVPPAAGSPSAPLPVYLIGDSSVCSLSDRVYRASSGTTYLFRTRYVPGLRIADFAGPGGALGTAVADALRADGLTVTLGTVVQATHETANPHWRWIRTLEHRAASVPPLVISAGFLDVMAVGAGIAEPDVVLPDAVLASAAVPPTCRSAAPGALDAGSATARFAAAFAPVRVGLRQLRALGFTRLGVFGLAPLTRDEDLLDRAVERTEFAAAPRVSRVAFRHKTLLLANAEIARLCREESAAYIDRWLAYVDDDGFVRPGVLSDFVHVTPDAAKHAAASIVTDLVERDRRVVAESPASGDQLDDGVAHGTVRVDLAGAHLRALEALANVRRGGRVLAVGAVDAELVRAMAADAHVTTVSEDADDLVAATEAAANRDAFDVAVATAGDELPPGERDRRYARIAAALQPAGWVIVHARRNRNGAASGPVDTAGRLRRRLRAVFPHVVVWLADRRDVRGSLAGPLDRTAARAATDVYTVAAHTIDPAALLRRLTTEAIDVDDMGVRIGEPCAPRRVPRDQRFFVEVTLHNDTGAVLSSFPPSPVRFAPIWLDEDGRQLDGDHARSPIAPAAQPHESARYAIGARAPLAPGRYTVRIGLVQEFVRWFPTSADVAVTVV